MRTAHQCCQMVFVKMREKIVKMREKMRQPTMSKFLLHFWTFQRGYKNQSSNIFWKIIKKSHFYVVKFFNVQNVPHFWLFTQCAKVLSKCARGGTKCAIFAQLRKIWQHCCACAEEKNKMMKMLRLCLCSPLSIPRIKGQLKVFYGCGPCGLAANHKEYQED